MPRPKAGARLYQLKSKIFVIREAGRPQQSTGTRDRRKAEAALARYIAERDRPVGPKTPEKMTVAGALDLYGSEHAPNTLCPERIGYAIAAIVPILGSLTLSNITGQICRFYEKERGRSPGTVRKELGVLQAAINFCHTEGYLTAPVKVKLPAKSAPRDRWLTRDEAAKLLWAAWRNPKSKHLARFILIALYTGTRSEAITALQFMPNTRGGHVDTQRGMMYRRSAAEAESNKRKPPIHIPRQLLAHLRRWERDGSRYVVHVRGSRVGNVNNSWKAALKQSGIDHCTRHDLRHTAITWCMQYGADKWAAAGFFGVSLDVLEKVYGHHHPDHMRSAVRAMEGKSFLYDRTETTALKAV